MNYLNRLSIAGLVAVCTFPITALGQLNDEVITSKGRKEGTIVSTSPNSVTLDVRGVEEPISLLDIRLVRFADEPTPLQTAKKYLLDGNVDSAKSELEKITLSTVKQDKIKREVEYYTAYCDATLAMGGGGNKAQAITTLRKFVENKDDPSYLQTYHFYEAARLLGDLAMSEGAFADAERFYGYLERAPGNWAEHRFQAKVLVADAQLAGRKYDEALKNYETVAKQSGTKETARYIELAKVGQAVCKAGVNKPDEGIAIANKIIQDEPDPRDPELFGKTYNALGACYLKKYESETDARKKESYMKQALTAFLHTDLLFWQDADAHAEALYHLSNLWRQVQNPDRASQARQTLIDRYRGSRWRQMLEA